MSRIKITTVRERTSGDDLPIVAFASNEAWVAWLERKHESSPGLWIKFARRKSGITSVTYDQALDTALCFGWIDGQRKPFDERFYLLRFTQRRARSKWSQANRYRADRMIEQGAIKSAGLAEVNRAKADGRWDAAYPAQSTATIPDDLQRLLDRKPKAAAFFASLDRLNRYAVLHRIHDAKRPQTRAKRIAKFVEMLDRGDRIHPLGSTVAKDLP